MVLVLLWIKSTLAEVVQFIHGYLGKKSDMKVGKLVKVISIIVPEVSWYKSCNIMLQWIIPLSHITQIQIADEKKYNLA